MRWDGGLLKYVPVGTSSPKVVYIRPGGQGIISTKYLADPSSGLGGVREHADTHTDALRELRYRFDLTVTLTLRSR